MKKRILLFLIIVAAIMVIACPVDPPVEDPPPDDPIVDPDPPPNNPPAVTFPEGDIQVSGAGSTSVNGAYEENGTHNSAPLFTPIGAGVNKIFYANYSGHPFPPPGGDFWCIDPDENTASLVDLEYHKYGTASLPPETGWSNLQALGVSPAPTLLFVPISGSPTVGSTVEVEYNFSDPDGDGEGTSTYRWFRCDTAVDAGTVIAGATGKTYTTTGADSSKYLKAEVTPVDDRGGVGTAVKSTASRQIS